MYTRQQIFSLRLTTLNLTVMDIATQPQVGRQAVGSDGAARPDSLSLHGLIVEASEPGITVRTDGLPAYLGLSGYVHDRQVQRRQAEGEYLLPRVHRVVSLLKRWMLGTHQGAVGHGQREAYLDEFTFRF